MSVELQQPLIANNGGGAAGAKKEVKLPSVCRDATWFELKKYNFEIYFTTDPNSKPVVVIVTNLICVAILTILFYLTNNLHQLSGTHRFLEVMWMSFGKMGGGGGMGPNGFLWPTRTILILSGFMKMIAFSLLVNFIGDALDSRMEALFEGKSAVLEENFVLILGWSDKILPLVEQLTLANESDGGHPIVIMSEVYKPDMDAFLLDNIEDWRGSKLVTRGGSPINPNDLDFVAAPVANSIVVLSQGFDPDEADAQAARAVLAITGGMKYPAKGHVVVELRDRDNTPVVKLGIVGNYTEEEKEKRVLPCIGADLIGRLMVQCSVEPGLARVFDHLLAFEYNEFYFKEWPECHNKAFAACCFMFENAVCIGIVTPEKVDGKYIFLNPPGDTVINRGDTLIFIAEDDNTYSPGEEARPGVGPGPDVQADPKGPTKTLLIGWRRDMQDMIFEVDKWVEPGSELTILAPGNDPDIYNPTGPSLEERKEELEAADCFVEKLTNVKVTQKEGCTIIRSALEDAGIANFHAVLVLTAEMEGKEGITSDSRSMVTMLLARDVQRKFNTAGIIGREPILICEILDPRTADLVSIAAANDHMVSNRMISEVLGQMSQQSLIHPLIEDLFCPEGNEMHIKPIKYYAAPGEVLCFWDIAARARMRCEIAIGYYCVGSGNELVINPVRNNEGLPDKRTQINWQDGDRIVVISED